MQNDSFWGTLQPNNFNNYLCIPILHTYISMKLGWYGTSLQLCFLSQIKKPLAYKASKNEQLLRVECLQAIQSWNLISYDFGYCPFRILFQHAIVVRASTFSKALFRSHFHPIPSYCLARHGIALIIMKSSASVANATMEDKLWLRSFGTFALTSIFSRHCLMRAVAVSF